MQPDEFRKRFALAAFDDGGLLIDVGNGAYFQLNSSAVRILRAVSDADTTEDAVRTIADSGGLSLADAASLTRELLTALVRTTAGRSPDGPFSYVKRNDGYALLHGTTPVMNVDEAGELLRIEESGTAVRLLDCLRAVVPKILALQGTVVLHASAVSIDGQTTALSGPSGAGKTTTARALASGRAELVAEDLLVVVLEKDGVSAVRGSEGEIRRWQREAQDLLTRRPHEALPCTELRQVVAHAREPLAEIMFVSADRRAGEAIERTPLTRPEALRLLVENSFLGSAAPAAWRQHLDSAHHIARTVPAWTMTAPNGLDGLLRAARRYTGMTAS